MSKTKVIRIRFFAVISIVLLCIGVTIKSFQNDTFYMIKLGDYILHNGIDLKDHWCWITQLPYTYPHWLYDIIIALVYSYFGYDGIYVSTIILFIIFIFTIYIIHLKIHKNEFLALFISILSIVCLYGFATARAQLVTGTLFLWEVFFLEKLRSSGQKKYICFLVIISLLVANLHATIWCFYFILYLPFFGEHILYWLSQQKMFKKFFPLKKNDKVIFEKLVYYKKFLLAFVLGIFMGLFTPSRICYTYIFRVMMGDSQEFIMEHAPLVVIQHPCFMVFVLTGLLILIFSKTKICLRELFMIGGLLFMCLFSVRHLSFFYSIGLLYLSILAERYLRDKKDRTLDILLHFIVNNRVVYILLFISIIIGSCFKFQKNFVRDYVPREDYPVDAVVYIKKNFDLDNFRLYNDYNFGSYLLFSDIPVFIDSRCDLYLSEFNGLDYSIFDDEINMAYDYDEKFKFYDVTHVLVSKEDILYKILLKDSDYHNIYQDKNFILFEKG